MVLLVALALFDLLDDSRLQFMVLVLSLLSLGVVINIVFLIFIREKELCQIADASYKELGAMLLASRMSPELSPSPKTRMMRMKKRVTLKDWLKKPQLYWIGILYNMARLMSNYTTTMVAFYLVYVINIGEMVEDVTKTPWQLALVPLVMYIASVIASLA